MRMQQAKPGNAAICNRTLPKPPMGWPGSGNEEPRRLGRKRGSHVVTYSAGPQNVDQKGSKCKAIQRGELSDARNFFDTSVSEPPKDLVSI